VIDIFFSQQASADQLLTWVDERLATAKEKIQTLAARRDVQPASSDIEIRESEMNPPITTTFMETIV
jgi:hypothetical protein